MNINELKTKNFNQLVQIGTDLEVDNARAMREDDLVEQILQRQVERSGQVYATGILDIVDDGYGFMRRHGLMPSRTTSTSPLPRSDAPAFARATA